MRWMHTTVSPAVCVSSDGTRRASAARLLVGSLPLPAQLIALARSAAFEPAMPGRVTAGGSFELPAAHAALAVGLGSALAASLRRRFE